MYTCGCVRPILLFNVLILSHASEHCHPVNTAKITLELKGCRAPGPLMTRHFFKSLHHVKIPGLPFALSSVNYYALTNL